MALQIQTIKDQSVVIEVREATGTRMPVVAFSGLLTARDPGPLLTPFFDKLHQAMVREGQREVEIDITELRFMNSSSFKHFVSWLRLNGSLPNDQRYQINFLLSAAHHWQTASIGALSCFAEGKLQSTVLANGAPQAR